MTLAHVELLFYWIAALAVVVPTIRLFIHFKHRRK